MGGEKVGGEGGDYRGRGGRRNRDKKGGKERVERAGACETWWSERGEDGQWWGGGGGSGGGGGRVGRELRIDLKLGGGRGWGMG